MNQGENVMRWCVMLLCVLLLSGCGAVELPSSTQGEGSDALRPSPCACEWSDFEPPLYDWVES